MAQPNPSDKISLAYDIELCRPGCVLIQAVMGGDTSDFVQMTFDTSLWLLAPTDGMRVYTATREQWEWAARVKVPKPASNEDPNKFRQRQSRLETASTSRQHPPAKV